MQCAACDVQLIERIAMFSHTFTNVRLKLSFIQQTKRTRMASLFRVRHVFIFKKISGSNAEKMLQLTDTEFGGFH